MNALFWSLSFLSCAIAFEHPETEVIIDDYYGVKISDPYQYFENPEDPRVQKWSKSIAKKTDNYLSKLPIRDTILERLNALDGEKGASIRYVHRSPNGILYMAMRGEDDEYAKIYQKNPHENARLLVDPIRVTGADKPPSINYFSISPNQKMLFISISSGGSENGSLYVLSFPDMQVVEGPIARARWSCAQWLDDSSGFIYSRLQELGADTDKQETFQRSKTYLHKVGTNPEKDRPIVGIDVNKEIKVAPSDLPFACRIPGTDWLVSYNSTGVSQDYIMHLTSVESFLLGEEKWVPVSERRHLVGQLAISRDNLYLLTRLNAPNGKIVRTSVNSPNIEEAEIIFEPKDGSIKGMVQAKDALYVKINDKGPNRLIRLPYETPSQPESIETPENSSFRLQSWLGFGSDQNGVLLKVSSWTEEERFFVVHPDELEARPMNLIKKPASTKPIDLVTRQIMLPSHDGVEVPASIIHKKGIKMNGQNPVMLYGYGAYGHTIGPSFWNTDQILYEENAIKVVAHVRGGGALGDKWRLAGKEAQKPNTWKDLIAVAEGLVKLGYTSPEHICISGRSAGGILVGRAMTEAPYKFGAVLSGVGVNDAIRMETTPNGVPNIPEFGSTKTEAGFHALHAMSAYHHINDNTVYPATMIYHGANDTRVDLWQSLKMAARLVAAESNTSQTLMRIDYDAGHGSGASKSQRNQLYADMLAFFFQQCRGE